MVNALELCERGALLCGEERGHLRLADAPETVSEVVKTRGLGETFHAGGFASAPLRLDKEGQCHARRQTTLLLLLGIQGDARKSPNEPKVSESGVRRGSCGSGAEQEAWRTELFAGLP